MTAATPPPSTSSAPATPPDGSAKRDRIRRRLDRLRLVMLGALAVQLLLGMANNLWLDQPEPNLDHASPQSLLSAHTTWAYVLIVLAVWILVDAVRIRRERGVLPAAAGLVGVLVAYSSGLVYYVTESDVWSFLMTIGFTLAILAYALAGRQWTPR